MTHINWEDKLYFDPNDPTNAFATHGVPIPTYGNYGGAGYTAGVMGGRTPEPFQLTQETQPVDDLDMLFYKHDLVYQHFQDGVIPPSDIPVADARLIAGMGQLLYTDPGNAHYDPEAGLYEGLAVFGIALKLETELAGAHTDLNSFLALPELVPFANQVLSAMAEAPHNFQVGLQQVPGEAKSLHATLPLFQHFLQDFATV